MSSELTVRVVVTAGHTLPVPKGTGELIQGILQKATAGTDMCQGVYTFQLGAKIKGRPQMPAFKLVKFDQDRFIRVKVMPGDNGTCHSGTIVPADGVSVRRLYRAIERSLKVSARSANKESRRLTIERAIENRTANKEVALDKTASLAPAETIPNPEFTPPPGLSSFQLPVYKKLSELSANGRLVRIELLASALRKDGIEVTPIGLGRSIGALVRMGLLRSVSAGITKHAQVGLSLQKPNEQKVEDETSGNTAETMQESGKFVATENVLFVEALVVSREAELARLEADLRNLEEKHRLLSEEIMKLKELQRQVSTD